MTSGREIRRHVATRHRTYPRSGSALTQFPDEKRTENERDYPKREDSLTKATWSGVAGATLTYESDGRPWRDACLFLALSGYRCSDSSAGGPWQSGSSCSGRVGTLYSVERCRSISPTCLPAVHNQR